MSVLLGRPFFGSDCGERKIDVPFTCPNFSCFHYHFSDLHACRTDLVDGGLDSSGLCYRYQGRWRSLHAGAAQLRRGKAQRRNGGKSEEEGQSGRLAVTHATAAAPQSARTALARPRAKEGQPRDALPGRFADPSVSKPVRCGPKCRRARRPGAPRRRRFRRPQ